MKDIMDEDKRLEEELKLSLIHISGERTDAELVFENALAEELTISCTGGGSVRIDDLNLYTFVTEGDISVSYTHLRIISRGTALPNTGTPGLIGGAGKERVIHSPAMGILFGKVRIGDRVEKGQPVAVIVTGQGEVVVEASLTRCV